VYARRPDAYRWARSSFIVLNLIGVTCFALYPLMPPRLLAGAGYVDTVLRGHTWGSWGSPLVAHANVLAAMPSLHVGWALWVSVLLGYLSGGRVMQGISAVHVLLTAYVIMATANHYVVDALAAVPLVWVSAWVGRWLSPRPGDAPRPGERGRAGVRVPAADSFFLHVESEAAPQHVGGVVLLDTADIPLDRERVAAAVRAALPELPRFRQQLVPPAPRLRPRWVDLPDSALDWSWHVPECDLGGAGPRQPDETGRLDETGRPNELGRLHELVAEIAATRLPVDRPMWRLFVVQGVAEDRAAVVLVVHHVIADGVGTVAQALRFLEPALPVPAPDGARPGPGRLARLAATGAGLVQLATDGRPAGRLPGATSGRRGFASVMLPLAEVRRLARRHGVRVTDLLLAGTASAVARTAGGQAAALPAALRAAVTLVLRPPGAAQEGNLTAGVIVDLPLDSGDELRRLRTIAGRTRRLRTPTRALASRFVMQAVGELMPVPVHGWFARTVYGGRYFHAIVSNMPGPDAQLHVAGVPIVGSFPLLPLAPGAPLAVGALGWHGQLCVGIATDPATIPDAEAFAAALRDALEQLSRAAPAGSSRARA
jgi:hypothetical protein